MARETVLDGTDQRGRQPRGDEDGVDKVSGCGFSVRARYAGDLQAAVGMFVEVGGNGRERLSAMLHLNPGMSELFRRRSFAQHRDSAFRNCVCGKLPAVGLRSGKCKKQVPRLHLARVESDALNL